MMYSLTPLNFRWTIPLNCSFMNLRRDKLLFLEWPNQVINCLFFRLSTIDRQKRVFYTFRMTIVKQDNANRRIPVSNKNPPGD
jgi:hypothetical protein